MTERVPLLDQSIDAQQVPARALGMYGQVWIVYERETPSGSSLVFETKDFVDDIEDYPANWRELRDKQLYQLRWSRSDVRYPAVVKD